MNISSYKQLIEAELWMYDTSELLDSGLVTTFNDFFIIDKTMYCNNCKHYGNHCGTFGWCTREVFSNDGGCLVYIKTNPDFCCNKWETV